MAATALGLAGGVFSALGTIQQGEAQKNALSYQSQVARNNAVMFKQAAEYEDTVTGQKVAVAELKNRADIGTITATQGASGVTAKTGSNRTVLKSAAEIGALNAATEQQKGQAKAYGIRQQAVNEGAKAGLYDYESKQVMPGAYLGAAGQFAGVSAKWLSPTTV